MSEQRKNSKLTKNQYEFLRLVKAGNPDGEGSVDLDQLLEKLSWKPSKAAVHFSIRALSKRDLLEKEPELVLRRGRLRVVFRLLPEGEAFLDPRDSVKADSLPVDNSKTAQKSSKMDLHSDPFLGSQIEIDFRELSL